MTVLEKNGKKVHVNFHPTVSDDGVLYTHYVKETGQWYRSEKRAITSARKYLRAILSLPDFC
jgi:hypothetical protein